MFFQQRNDPSFSTRGSVSEGVESPTDSVNSTVFNIHKERRSVSCGDVQRLPIRCLLNWQHQLSKKSSSQSNGFSDESDMSACLHNRSQRDSHRDTETYGGCHKAWGSANSSSNNFANNTSSNSDRHCSTSNYSIYQKGRACGLCHGRRYSTIKNFEK